MTCSTVNSMCLHVPYLKGFLAKYLPSYTNVLVIGRLRSTGWYAQMCRVLP